MWFVVPMVGASYTPLYVACERDEAQRKADAMNLVLGSEMFEVEGMLNQKGGLNFQFHRDADRMCWVDDLTGNRL